MPKVSVIMGVYNSRDSKMLGRAIDSILNQTFKDFEFIICNDCSTKDFIRPQLLEYAKKDSRIVLIENERNLGLAATLNHCLEVATGEFIARQDDDDVSLPNRLERELTFLETNPDFGFVGSPLILIDDGGIWGRLPLKEKPVLKDFVYGCTFSHPTLLVRNQCFNDVGGYTVSKQTRRTEDYDLYFKFYTHGIFGANIQEDLFLYHMSPYTFAKQKFKYRIDEFTLRKYWFKKCGFGNKYILYTVKPIVSALLPGWIKENKKKRDYYISPEEKKKLNAEYGKYL